MAPSLAGMVQWSNQKDYGKPVEAVQPKTGKGLFPRCIMPHSGPRCMSYYSGILLIVLCLLLVNDRALEKIR